MRKKRFPNGYWIFDNVQKEALKYKYKRDFYINSKLAYSAAYRLDIIDKVCRHMLKNPSRSKWTKELCQLEALKYKQRSHFRDGSNGAYCAARKSGILNEICDHMTRPLSHRLKWSKSKVIKEALKYTFRSEFQTKSKGAYKYALRKGYLNEICSHMIRPKSHKLKWTKDKIKKEALKYNTRNEFRLQSGSAWSRARQINILDEVCNHMLILGNLYDRCVYQIINVKTNEIYIGITGNYEIRISNHHKWAFLQSGAVSYKLTKYLPVKEAIRLEKKWIKHFKNHSNFTCLNKTIGGELGN